MAVAATWCTRTCSTSSRERGRKSCSTTSSSPNRIAQTFTTRRRAVDGPAVRRASWRRRLAISARVVFVGDATDRTIQREQPAAPVALAIALPGPRFAPRRRRSNAARASTRRCRRCRDGARRRRTTSRVLDDDGVMRRYVPFVRVGDDYDPVSGRRGRRRGARLEGIRCAARARSDSAARRSPCSADRVRRSRRSMAATRVGRRRRSLTAACGRTCAGPIRRTRSRSCFSPRSSCSPRRSRSSIRQVSRQDRHRRRTAAALYDQKAVPFAQKMSGPEMHAQMLDSILSDRFLERRPRGRRRSVLRRIALGVRVHRSRLVGTWPGVSLRLVAGCESRLRADGGLFGRGDVGAARRAASQRRAGDVRRRRLSVLRRRPREAPRRSACSRATSRRMSTSSCSPSPVDAQPRRHAAAHDGSVLRYPRLHGGVRARRARSDRRAAEPVLLAHGADRVRESRAPSTSSSAT